MDRTQTALKIQGLYDGAVYGTSGRAVVTETGTQRYERRGRLPIPEQTGLDVSYRLKNVAPWRSLVERLVGRFPTTNVWRPTEETFIASDTRWVYASSDGGSTWRTTAELPPSSGTMGVLPSAFCAHDGSFYLGEYPLDGDATPRVRRSDDGGETWTTEIALPDVRHVHAIQADPYTGTLWLTTGDADAACRIGRLRDGAFDVVGGGDQTWRAVELAFTPTSVVWGVDSVYTASNPILELSRDALDAASPTPEPRTTVESSVYYSATMTVDGEHWVVFSTAAEAGGDRTADDTDAVVGGTRARVLAASSRSGYERWYEIATYDRKRSVSDVGPLGDRLPSANAYVYLAASDERGLFVNPYNTARHDGSVRHFRPAYFEARATDQAHVS
jgi:hypothetical protein